MEGRQREDRIKRKTETEKKGITLTNYIVYIPYGVVWYKAWLQPAAKRANNPKTERVASGLGAKAFG